jgi:hypothetical protein
MNLHIKENYFETGVSLEENKKQSADTSWNDILSCGKYVSYKVDGIVAEHNHNILRLPPYHPELNPVELIWATVKDWVAQNNTTFRMDDVIKLADQNIGNVGTNM